MAKLRVCNINMYHSSKAMFHRDENFAIVSSFRHKYDADELSLLIAREASCNPIVQYFFKNELGHEIEEHSERFKKDSKMFIDLFRLEWRQFYWRGLFSVLGDRASLNDKSVLASKISKLDFFMKQIGRFIMRHCFDSKPQVVVADMSAVPQLSPDLVKIKNFRLTSLNSDEVARARAALESEFKAVSLPVPEYLFKPIRRPTEDDHLVFLWLKRLSGESVNNEQFFEQSAQAGTRSRAYLQGHHFRSELQAQAQPESAESEVEFRRQSLKSKLIENRNQNFFPLATTEFLYSPHFNSKLLNRFQSTMFFNLNTDLDYQFKKKSFLLGNEVWGLNLELRKMNTFFSRYFSQFPTNASMRFFSKNRRLAHRFQTMQVTPQNLRDLYFDSINKLKQTVSGIIDGRNECLFEPGILAVLVFILSLHSKKRFSRIDRQFRRCRQVTFDEMVSKPRYFVKCLTLRPPKPEDNLGIFTYKLNKILDDKHRCEETLLKLIDPPKHSNPDHFPNYFPSGPGRPGDFRLSQPVGHDFGRLGRPVFPESMSRGGLQESRLGSVLGAPFADSFAQSRFPCEFQKDYSKFLKVLLAEVTDKDKRVILSQSIIQKLESISLGYQMRKLFRDNPIYDFKALKKNLGNLNRQDHNTFELEQGQLLFNKSQRVFNRIQQCNEKFCAELQTSLSASQFSLEDFQFAIRELTSKAKLELYRELMQDSLNTFFIDKHFLEFLANLNFLHEICLTVGRFHKRVAARDLLQRSPVHIFNDYFFGRSSPGRGHSIDFFKMLWLTDYSRLLRCARFLTITCYACSQMKELFILLFNNFVFLIFAHLIRSVFRTQEKFLSSSTKVKFILQRESALSRLDIGFDKDLVPFYRLTPEQPSSAPPAATDDLEDLSKLEFVHKEAEVIEYVKRFRRVYARVGKWNKNHHLSEKWLVENSIFYQMKLEDLIKMTKKMYAVPSARSAGRGQNLVLDCYLIVKYLSNFLKKPRISLKKPFENYTLYFRGMVFSGNTNQSRPKS